MKADVIKSVFFYSLGVFNIFPWNAILNLNAFFEESFKNLDISKLYTSAFFVMLPISLYLAVKLN